MTNALFRIDTLSAMVMLTVRDAENKTPLGIRSHMKEYFGLNIDIRAICQKLRELAYANFCYVTVGENTWEVTEEANDALRKRHPVE